MQCWWCGPGHIQTQLTASPMFYNPFWAYINIRTKSFFWIGCKCLVRCHHLFCMAKPKQNKSTKQQCMSPLSLFVDNLHHNLIEFWDFSASLGVTTATPQNIGCPTCHPHVRTSILQALLLVFIKSLLWKAKAGHS